MSESDLTIRFDDDRRDFEPGDTLGADCEIAYHSLDEITGVEWTVYWRTEGRGTEDSDEHASARKSTGTESAARGADALRFETQLPLSPLSYDGVLVKIRWFLAASVSFSGGREVETETEFRLGSIAPMTEVQALDKHD